MDTAQMVVEARRQLVEGHAKEAARLLTDAAYETHDPDLEREIHAVAVEGREKAGRFGKARWDEIIRIAELRGGTEAR